MTKGLLALLLEQMSILNQLAAAYALDANTEGMTRLSLHLRDCHRGSHDSEMSQRFKNERDEKRRALVAKFEENQKRMTEMVAALEAA